LTFLDGVAGVFFRALALTMTVALLTSLVLAITLTPSLAAWFVRDHAHMPHQHNSAGQDGGVVLRHFLWLYEAGLRSALRFRWLTLFGCVLVFGGGILIYANLATDFLPAMDEGGFVIDYHSPYGTSLTETNRQLLQAEAILRATPEVEG